ncbi:MAG TPA: SUF system NifU family Fe-S cluster assembly protein [Longimicrobiaceae bacterium]|nr:SUF system NifU family Fe-S cluster assembly protein [Longimicrobiaceae bacterium]
MPDNSTPPLNALYQELILDHYRRPRHRGEMESPDVEVRLNNPTCGDEIVLQLRVRVGTVEEVRFAGQGCSISQASASMMAQLVTGKPLAEAEALTARFKEMLHGDPEAAKDRALGDLRALAGVAKFPVRVRCAMLAWNALEEAERRLPPPAAAGDAGSPGSPGRAGADVDDTDRGRIQ